MDLNATFIHCQPEFFWTFKMPPSTVNRTLHARQMAATL